MCPLHCLANESRAKIGFKINIAAVQYTSVSDNSANPDFIDFPVIW